MNNNEIIELGCDVFSKITSDLNEDIYSKLNGRLSIHWHTDELFYAYAGSDPKAIDSPKHSIGITYYTLILLYRDIEDYYSYIEYGADNSNFDIIFQDFEYPKTLSSFSPEEHCCKNMFISGITWILFHELGHLIQEHGYVRSHYNCDEGIEIIDCAANDSKSKTPLSGKASAVSHVTEMAADFYATISCLRSLLFHFEGEELEAEIKSFTSALALVLYRFHGNNSYVPTEIPEGTHPQPLIRLEQTMPLVFETYSNSGLLKDGKSNLTRLDLINITSWSSITAGFFWLRKNGKTNIPDDYFLSGSQQRPGMTRYHKIILETWDEIKPVIDKVKRMNDPITELEFNAHYREILSAE